METLVNLAHDRKWSKLISRLKSRSFSSAELSECRRGRHALWWAARRGEATVCRALVHFGADVNLGTEVGTPLSEAARQCHVSVLQTLLKLGADVGMINLRGMPSDSRNTVDGNSQVIQVLLEAGVKPSSSDLTWCIQNNKGDLLKKIVELHPNVFIYENTPTGYPLHAAIVSGDSYTIQLLLHMPSCPVNRADTRGVTPLEAAFRHGHADLCRRLAPRVSPSDEELQKALAICVKHADLPALRVLLQSYQVCVRLAHRSREVALAVGKIGDSQLLSRVVSSMRCFEREDQISLLIGALITRNYDLLPTITRVCRDLPPRLQRMEICQKNVDSIVSVLKDTLGNVPLLDLIPTVSNSLVDLLPKLAPAEVREAPALLHLESCAEDPVFAAIATDNAEELSYYLADGLDPNQLMGSFTLLALSVVFASTECLSLILAFGADYNLPVHSTPPLILALDEHRQSCAITLLAAGASVSGTFRCTVDGASQSWEMTRIVINRGLHNVFSKVMALPRCLSADGECTQVHKWAVKGRSPDILLQLQRKACCASKEFLVYAVFHASQPVFAALLVSAPWSGADLVAAGAQVRALVVGATATHRQRLLGIADMIDEQFRETVSKKTK